MKPTVFIDADILLHRAVSFVDDEFDGEKSNDWRTAMRYFDYLLDRWLKGVGKYDDYYLVLSGDTNFRKDVYSEYKANRRSIVPHGALRSLKEEVMELNATILEEGIEADDLIGIRCSEDPKHTLAVSADKDFATVPCNLYIPASHGRKVGAWHTFSEEDANLNWMIQTMTGDSVDNYKGVPSIGPKKAAAILPRPAPLSYLWGNVRQTFIDKGLTEADAIQMARLARILRDGDYDFEKQEVRLWTPYPERGNDGEKQTSVAVGRE